ncbi:MAG: 4-oxalocrotonate tautomerase [Spirochaetales bacterium]|jgi:4-oxalocrotonate tautomerase|nr:4-oxalocrotonate tautomerase [Spirochaetales bacterium]
MPHIVVKLYPGRSEEQKMKLTDEIVASVAKITDSEESIISVGFDEIQPEDWKTEVYDPDIAAKPDTLTKKPGYTL